MYCCVIAPNDDWEGQVICGQTDYSFAYSIRFATRHFGRPFFPSPERMCYEEAGTNLCRNITGRNTPSHEPMVGTSFVQLFREAFLFKD